MRGGAQRRALGGRDGGAAGDPARAEILRRVAAALLAGAAASAGAAEFVFATREEAQAVLGAEDDFIVATTDLERRARLRTASPVDRSFFAAQLASHALEWPEDDRRTVGAVAERIQPLLASLKLRAPERILLVRAAQALEEGAPHTRANAMMLPARWISGPPERLVYALAHELFHVLSRNDRDTRERLYAAIGFRRCERIEIPTDIAALRITNPDAVENRHAIQVRLRGETVGAMPYIMFATPWPDLQKSFFQNARRAWLLVDREGGICRARAQTVTVAELEGLFDQIGRNTNYLAHPEEIVADNFAILVMRELGGGPPKIASPEVLERLRQVLFR